MESDFLYRLKIGIVFILIWIIGHILYVLQHCSEPNCNETRNLETNIFIPVVKNKAELSIKAQESIYHISYNKEIVNLIKYHFSVRNKVFEPSYINSLSHFCLNKTPFTIVVVSSSPSDFEKRSLIRKIWTSQNITHEAGIHTVFFVGTEKGNDTFIRNEIKQYNDIVHVNISDEVESSVLKALTSLHWVINYCPEVKWFMKSDINVLLNPIKLKRFLDTIDETQSKNAIICRENKSIHVHPCRYNCQRDLVSIEEYPLKYYPRYCIGREYIISRSLLNRLYEEGSKRKIFRLENIYVTGIIPLFLNDSPPMYRYLPENYITLTSKKALLYSNRYGSLGASTN